MAPRHMETRPGSAVAWNHRRYAVIEIPQSSTTAASINNARAVTGSTAEHAFLYSHGRFVDLGTLGGEISGGAGVNARGEVTGHSQLIPNDFGTIHAFLYRHGVMIDLGTLGGRSYGRAINDAGTVVGYSELGDDFTTRAFLYGRGVMHDLGTLGGFSSWAYGINNRGEVTGSSQPDDGGPVIHAFLYRDGTMADLGTLGGANSEGRAINNAGQVTGWSYRKDDNFHHAFLYREGEMIDLGISALESEGSGINAWGDVVGSECDRDLGCRAFLYSRGKVIDLNQCWIP